MDNEAFKELAALSSELRGLQSKLNQARQLAEQTYEQFKKAVKKFAAGRSTGTIYYFQFGSELHKLQYSDNGGWNLIPIDVTVIE